MAKRILLVMMDATVDNSLNAVLGAAGLARDSGGMVRLMYSHPMPPARVDRYDRVVADTDREMGRIRAQAEEQLRVLAAECGAVPVEPVVRFGRLSEEVFLEAHAFGADLVALAAPLRPGLRHRALAWYLERLVFASKLRVVLLPIPADITRDRSGDELVMATLR